MHSAIYSIEYIAECMDEIASYRDYTNIQQLLKLHKPNHLSKRLLRTGFRHYTI